LHLITIRHDLDTIALILNQTFELPPFKRDYDSAFGKVADKVLTIAKCSKRGISKIGIKQYNLSYSGVSSNQSKIRWFEIAGAPH
jgi:hypothetical protein